MGPCDLSKNKQSNTCGCSPAFSSAQPQISKEREEEEERARKREESEGEGGGGGQDTSHHKSINKIPKRERKRAKEKESGREWGRDMERRETLKERRIDKCNFVSVATLSQRESVGRVIKCTQQLCDKRNECAGVQQCQVHVQSNTHSQLGPALCPS